MDYFYGEPTLVPQTDGIHWSVLFPYKIDDDVLGEINVPNGFVTDLGSIPKIFQNIISPEGKPLRAYLIHDYLYATQKNVRSQADACLMRMMYALNVGFVERWVIYLAVRLGGSSSWNEDTKEKNNEKVVA